jgi:hypothetical protein
MQVRVELLSRRVELLDSMPPERLQQLLLGHLNSVEEVNELLLLGGDGLGGMLEGESEDVDRAEEVGGELLDGERFGFGLLLGRATLEVGEVGLGVLESGLRGGRRNGGKGKDGGRKSVSSSS